MIVVIERGVYGHPVEPEIDHPEAVRASTVNAIDSEMGYQENRSVVVVNNVTPSACHKSQKLYFYPPLLLLIAARSDG